MLLTREFTIHLRHAKCISPILEGNGMGHAERIVGKEKRSAKLGPAGCKEGGGRGEQENGAMT